MIIPLSAIAAVVQRRDRHGGRSLALESPSNRRALAAVAEWAPRGLHWRIKAWLPIVAVRSCGSMMHLRVVISMRQYKPDDRVTTLFRFQSLMTRLTFSRATPAIAARSLWLILWRITRHPAPSSSPTI